MQDLTKRRAFCAAAPRQCDDGTNRLGCESERKVELMPVSRLKPYRANARTHSRKQIRQIADSIERFGFTNPILMDDHGEIIAGHGRVAAAKLLGLNEVPTLRLSNLSPTEKRAYILADNKLAEKAGWDREILAIELQGLIDLDFEVELTGFEMGEIDIILDDADEAKGEAAGPEDEVPEPIPGPSVSQPGDLWRLGKHRILCGDALDHGAYERLLDGEKAEFIFTDPPYNVPIDGNVCGKGAIRHREFVMASGEMSKEAFTGFLTAVFRHLVVHSTDGSIHDICMDWRHIAEMMAAGNEVYSELKNLCVWAKTNAGMGTFYRSRHELVFVWKSGAALTSTTSSLASTAAAARMCGSMPGSAPCEPGGSRSWRCTRPSSRSRWWRTRSRTARAAMASSSILSWGQRHDLIAAERSGRTCPRHRDRSRLCRRRD